MSQGSPRQTLPAADQFEALYRLPYDWFGKLAGSVRHIVPSVKFSEGKVERNRYYVDLVAGGSGASIDVDQLAIDWGAPEAARALLRDQYRRFGDLRFVGAGPTHGQMAFRIYLGFSGSIGVGTKGAETNGDGEISAISVDWVPHSDHHTLKTYRELQAVPRLKLLSMIRDCLCDDRDPPTLSGNALLVYELCAEISRKAQGALHLSQIREPGNQRHSVAYNYFRCAHTSNVDIQSELDAIAAVFGLPPHQYRQWLEQTQDLAMVDIAVGVNWRGEPFVTLYHGFLDQPPAFVPEPQFAKVSFQSARPADSVTPPVALSDHPSVSRHLDTRGVVADDVSISTARPVGSLVYVVGQIGFTYQSQSRRTAAGQLCGGDPDAVDSLLNLLNRDSTTATLPLWTLGIGSHPSYAVVPDGAYADLAYDRLRESLGSGSGAGGDHPLVAIAGQLAGQVRTCRGQMLPVIRPQLRGTKSLSTDNLVADVHELRDWRKRLLEEARNLGQTAKHRAINYTSAFLLELPEVCQRVTGEGLDLASISAQRAVIALGHRDCWDVQLTFFHPRERLRRAKLAVRLTIDVSDVVPYLISEPRIWHLP